MAACTESDRPLPEPTSPRIVTSTPPVAVSSAPPLSTSTPIPASPTRERPFEARSVEVTARRVGEGFTHPLYVTHTGSGSGRVYVAEKVGRVRLLDGTTLLDIRSRVKSPGLGPYEQEQGFLGLAFHPNFQVNGYVFAHYIDLRGGHVVSRFTAQPGFIDPNSEKMILTLSQPEVTFNGGELAFGPDGYLYLGLGTGGIPTERQLLAQNFGSLFGKILRLDIDRGDPYGIPSDNPFVGRPGARPEVWHYGLRNPYRFSWDRATGDLYVGGPGHIRQEWLNFLPAGTPGGQNFGWPILEGTLCFLQPNCDRRGLLPPILAYDHTQGNCVVIGGYVYRGRQSPALRGAYLYGDFCSGRVWAAGRTAAGAWMTTEVVRIRGMISSFGEDEAGEVYVTDIQNGVIYQLIGTPR